jgi:hypothetical protein
VAASEDFICPATRVESRGVVGPLRELLRLKEDPVVPLKAMCSH